MTTDRSHDVSTLHRGELDQLISDLVEAGFTPIGGDRHRWCGPINPGLGRLTSAGEMRIELRDGWPYIHPYLFANGLVGRRHVNAFGNVCLWPENEDRNSEWTRLDAIQARIAEWVADQEAGAPDPPLDAHLYFSGPSSHRLLTLDIEGLIRQGEVRRGDGQHGALRAKLARDVFEVSDRGNLTALWFWRSSVDSPPTDEGRFFDSLTRDQRHAFARLTNRLSASRPSLAILLWDDAGETNALALELAGAGGRHVAKVVEVARTDPSVIRIRAGPDAPVLASKTVAVFGVGAIGSEVTMLLARSGIGRFALVDHERLRPGNLARHTASGRFVGQTKSKAMAATVADSLPGVRVVAFTGPLWDASLLQPVFDASDLVVEATGNRAYRDLLSRVAEASGVPMVGIALHRGGSIARTNIQAGGTFPIWARDGTNGFPEVPAPPEPLPAPAWETGCGSPVNNAPPIAVARAAALAAQAGVDILAGRGGGDRDIVDVYEPIEAAPFIREGRLVFEPSR